MMEKPGGTNSRVCDLGKDTCGNPTAVVDQNTGTIHLFMNSSLGNRCQTQSQLEEDDCDATYKLGDRRVLYQSAMFQGQTLSFSERVDLTHLLQPKEDTFKFDFVGPGTGIQLQSSKYRNRLIIPAKHRNFIKNTRKDWKLSDGRVSENTSESSVVELSSGEILRIDPPSAQYTAKNLNRRLISISLDAGNTFRPTYADPTLLDPPMQGSMLHYSAGNISFANCATGAAGRRGLTFVLEKPPKQSQV